MVGGANKKGALAREDVVEGMYGFFSPLLVQVLFAVQQKLPVFSKLKIKQEK